MTPWAGVCIFCRRAIQSQEADGPWVNADGEECHTAKWRGGEPGHIGAHEPEVPPVIEGVDLPPRTVDQPGWVKRQTSAGWTVPEGWRFENLGACRTCGTPVAWCWTKAGNRAPVEKDGTPHFARCPQASQHRRR